MSDELRTWFVSYRVGRSMPDLWVEIGAVPALVKRAEVVELLEGWPRWAALKARIGVLGRITVSTRELPRLKSTQVVTWQDLAPVERVLSVPMPSTLHAAITRAAAEAGVSLRVWTRQVLAAAVGELPSVTRELGWEQLEGFGVGDDA